MSLDSCAEIKESPFSGVASSGRVWGKVPESDAQSRVCNSLPVNLRNAPTIDLFLLVFDKSFIGIIYNCESLINNIFSKLYIVPLRET